MAYKIPNVTGEFDPEEDAKTLTEAESIHSNPDRHKAALVHLANQKKVATNAYKTSRQALEKQTSRRMKQVFRQHAPFEAASDNQQTPYTEAAGGE